MGNGGLDSSWWTAPDLVTVVWTATTRDPDGPAGDGWNGRWMDVVHGDPR